jgi:hypothetical protein
MYIMAPESISTAYLINPYHKSVCLYVHPLVIVWQRLGTHVPAATNSQATIEYILYASFSIRFVSYQRKIGH